MNGATGCLNKDGIDRWKGSYVEKALAALKREKPNVDKAIEALEYCAKLTQESRDRGTELSDVFDKLAKHEPFDVKPEHVKFVEAWFAWQQEHKYQFVASEVHLISVPLLLHGSPDFIGYAKDGILEVGDYKCKGRKADYKLRMNEELYCELYEHATGNRPQRIRFVNFHPDTAKRHEDVFLRDPAVLADALLCRQFLEVNKRADAYYERNCKWKLKG